MPTVLHHLALLYAFWTAIILTSHAAGLLFLWTARVKVEEVVIHRGRPVMTLRTPWFPVSIGWMPLGGYVQFDIEEFYRRPAFVRCVLYLQGPLVLLASAFIFLPPREAVAEFMKSWDQLFGGALAPLERGVPLVETWFARADQSLAPAYVILGVKAAALNLIPAAGSALGSLFKGESWTSLRTCINLPLFIVSILLWIAWGVAITVYLLRV